jgi:hypothetical protein
MHYTVRMAGGLRRDFANMATDTSLVKPGGMLEAARLGADPEWATAASRWATAAR